MTNDNYIKCSDPETIKKLKQLGFVLLSESNGVATFLNNPSVIKQFNDLKVAFTNLIDV